MGRRKGLDFVRALSALGIIAFHFYCHSSSSQKLFYAHANGLWGGVLNYLFFALSGLVLHLKYSQVASLNVGEFYYKRWKSMMPAYLLVFLYAYIMKVFEYGSFFYMNIPKARLILTFIGMDGYFSWVSTTYFITGEWFLGAILMAYLAYPVIRKAISKSTVLTVFCAFVIYEFFLNVDIFSLPSAVNPATCLFSFIVGMFVATKFTNLKKPTVFIPAVVILLVFLLIPLEGSNITKEMIIGWSLLIVLYNVGEVVCQSKFCEKVILGLSGLTFYTFLIHHELIYRILEGFDSVSNKKSFCVLILTILITLVFSMILSIVMDRILNSPVVKKAERWIFRKNTLYESSLQN